MSVKIKKKIIGDDINKIFNQAIGGDSEIDIKICYQKFLNLKSDISKILSIIDMFTASTLFSTNPELEKECNELKHISSIYKSTYRLIFAFEINENSYLDLNQVPPEVRNEFTKMYKELKNSPLIDFCLKICNTLCLFKSSISNVKQLKYEVFINSAANVEPFNGSTLCFKRIFLLLDSQIHMKTVNVNGAKSMIQYILLLLNKLYLVSHSLYKNYTSPDVNVDIMVNIVISSIEDLKKRVGRCNKAFKAIVNSTNLLKENFNSYNRDFIETKNPSVFIENFIVDVSKKTSEDQDAETVSQLHRLIMFYKKEYNQSKTKNASFDKIFNVLNDQFDKLKQYSNLQNIDKDITVDDPDNSDNPDNKKPESLSDSESEDENNNSENADGKKEADSDSE